uniref:Uncharacterized protein n=1 Tax=Aureoumbra lagunensis TaxID=44058 RepID=A0A7S3JTT0_9STRA
MYRDVHSLDCLSARSRLQALRLDAPVLSPAATSSFDLVTAALMTALLSALAAAGAILAPVLSGVLVGGRSSSTRKRKYAVASEEDDSQGLALGERFGPRFRHWVRLRVGTARALWETCRFLWREAFGDNGVEMLADAWAPCVLEGVEEYGKYAVYRLALKAGPGKALPLEVGQAVSIMCLDSKSRVARAECWSAAFADANAWNRGVVDLVGPAAGKDRENDQEAKAVFDALDALGTGAEAAVRPGKRYFAYDGPHLPITRLVCFAQDAGSLPILQLLAESLPLGRSTVREADVYWIGSDETLEPQDDDLYAALEDLYYTYHTKMALNCILDDPSLDPPRVVTSEVTKSSPQPPPSKPQDTTTPPRRAGGPLGAAFGNPMRAPIEPPSAPEQPPRLGLFGRNPDLSEVVDVWRHGTLAVVAGSNDFNTDVSDHLTSALGYPTDCVLVFA